MRIRSFLLAGLAVISTAVLAVQGQTPGVNSNLATVFNLVYEASTTKPTYSSSSTFTAPAAPTDVCMLYGSASKTIRVRRVFLTGAAVAVQTDPFSVIRRSTVSSGGAGAIVTTGAYDSTFAAGTGVAEQYTTSPTTLGTFAAVVDLYMTYSNATTGVGVPLTFTFGQLGSPAVLRGVAEQLAVNMTGQAGSNTLNCTFEWTEE